jgi:hypothetical protein
MKRYELPIDYTSLHWTEKKEVRNQYIKEQDHKCYYCGCSLDEPAPKHITDKKINWKLFPPKVTPVKNFVFYVYIGSIGKCIFLIYLTESISSF